MAAVLAALNRDLGSVLGVRMLTQLRSMGAETFSEPVSETIVYWRRSVEENPENSEYRILLGQLLSDCELLDESLRNLQPFIADHPELRLP